MKKLFYALLFFVSFITSANADELINFYEVKDIPILQQGDNLPVMRDAAIMSGQRRAMDIFQQRLREKQLITDPLNITDSQINEAIESIEVRDEKIYTKSYRAKLNVAFSPKVISRIFNVAYIKPTPVPDKFLVMPILTDNDGVKIWRHKWWDMVQKLKYKNIVLPLGDLEDVRSFSREDYSVRDFRNLLKLQKKYGTTAILLVNAEYIPTEKAVNLNVEKIKNSESESFDYQIIAKSSESESELFALAANHLLKRIAANNFDEAFNPNSAEEEKLKDAPLTMQKTDEQTFRRASPAILEKRTETPSGTTEFKPENIPEAEAEPAEVAPAQDPNELLMTDVYVMANDLVSWGRMRQKITNTELIKNIRIKSFTAGKAFVTLTHNGEFVEVIAKLEESGMEVTKPSKYWEIREKKQ